MIAEQPSFIEPENPDQKIWRYLDFTKFVELVSSQELFFSRSDFLGDPYEGAIPNQTFEARKTVVNSMIEKKELLPVYRDGAGLSEMGKQNLQDMYVNCWHMNDHESAAMWKLYLKSNEGIAIQSRVKKLKESLADSTERIFLGKINYIDYQTGSTNWGDILSPFVHKRKSFEHEKELRAIIWEPTRKEKYGIKVKINIEILIDGIYVCPDSPAWMCELVSTVCKKYDLKVIPSQSSLSGTPIY